MSLTLRGEPSVDDDATRSVVVPGAPRRSRRSRAAAGTRPGRPSRLVTTVKWIVLAIAITLALLPVLYMVGMSFKTPDDILSTRILPSRLAIENWTGAFENWLPAELARRR